MMKVLLKKLTSTGKETEESIQLDVTNTDRTFGTIFGSEITRSYAGTGLDDDTYDKV